MNLKIIIKRVLVGMIVLLAIQTATYLIFAHRLLKHKLMAAELVTLNHSSDSVFVRDFFETNCFVGDPYAYYSHHLAADENDIKEKLRVKFVKFDTNSKDDNDEQHYRLVYCTWVKYAKIWMLYGFINESFSATQIEQLRINKKDFYEREIRYRWILFFWVKHFEFVRGSTSSASLEGDSDANR